MPNYGRGHSQFLWGDCHLVCRPVDTKNIMNITISTLGKKFMTMDLKYLYYGIPMD